MERAKAIFRDAGFEPNDVTLKVGTKKKGVARDILDEAQSGYDIIVVGRRGLSAVKEFFFGSVSQKVINGVKDVSVLIVN